MLVGFVFCITFCDTTYTMTNHLWHRVMLVAMAGLSQVLLCMCSAALTVAKHKQRSTSHLLVIPFLLCLAVFESSYGWKFLFGSVVLAFCLCVCLVGAGKLSFMKDALPSVKQAYLQSHMPTPILFGTSHSQPFLFACSCVPQHKGVR